MQSEQRPDDSCPPPVESIHEIDRVCSDFEKQYRLGREPRIEDYVDFRQPGSAQLFLELLATELELLNQAGVTPHQQGYAIRFPDHTDLVERCFAEFTSLPAKRLPTRTESERAERLNRILTNYHQAVHSAAREAAEFFVAKQRELLAANPELAGELQVHFESGETAEWFVASWDTATSETSTRVTTPGPDPPASSEADLAATLAHVSQDSGHVPSLRDYQLLEEIARGGMGVVYKARHKGLDRIVALKMIRSGELADSSEVERFITEARAAARLEHVGILPIYEIGEEHGQHYFTMAFVEGGSLQDMLTRGPLPPRKAAEWVQRTAEAIQHAHQQGIVHRDLKPANILIDKEGRPKVADFGLAKRLEEDRGLTASGTTMGTPSFMPPEQALGKVKEVGPLADVYSLGAVLYCLLTGRPPFATDNYLETLKQVVERDPPPLRTLNSAIPKDLETICLKCLRKQQTHRYASAAEFAEDLRRWQRGEPIKARRVSRLEKSWLWCTRRPLVSGLLAMVVLILCFGTALLIERQCASHAKGLVDALVIADANQVTPLLNQLEDYRWWTEPRLEERFAKQSAGTTASLYLKLALLRWDATHRDSLVEDLLNCQLRNYGVLRNELTHHKRDIQNRLWATFRNDPKASRRFRAGLALAHYVPAHPNWQPADTQFLVEFLLNRAPEEQPLLRSYLVDIKQRLYGHLREAFLNPQGRERQTIGAVKAFAEFAADDPDRIAELTTVATPQQYAVLFEVLEQSAVTPDLEALRQLIQQRPLADLPQPERIKLGKRRAGAAVTALRLGERESIFDVFRVTDDPESLTQFVHGCRERGVTPLELLECLNIADALRQETSGDRRELDDRLVFGLLLALGEYSLEDFPKPQALVDRLAHWYAMDPSSAIHGASGWLLRHWGQVDIARQIDQTPVPYSPDRQWYTLEVATSPQGPLGVEELKTYLTFVVFPAGTYTIGSPESEPERDGSEFRHEVKLSRPFAVLDREITWAEGTMANAPLTKGMREVHQKQRGNALGPHEPWMLTTWYDAILFCRWLTTQAEMGEAEQVYGDPESPDFQIDLNRHGFRLLTESEWEVACRAGTGVAWSFGSDSRMLKRYGWYAENSEGRTHEARLLRPNLRGLFDMHGNVSEWCHDYLGFYPSGVTRDPAGPETSAYRVRRGGCWFDQDTLSRSSYRNGHDPMERHFLLGFRVGVALPSPASVREQERGNTTSGASEAAGLTLPHDD